MIIGKYETIFLTKLHNSSNSDSLLNHRRTARQKPQDNTIVCWFLQPIWFYMQSNCFWFTAIMTLNKNTRAKVSSPADDTYFFDIVAGVLPRDTLASYPSKISPRTANVNKSLKKEKKRKGPYTKNSMKQLFCSFFIEPIDKQKCLSIFNSTETTQMI